MKILVTGSKGQLGNEIQVLSKRHPQHNYVFVDVDELDITNNTSVQQFFAQHQFDVCINCAAYTAVDKAEGDDTMAAL